MTDTPQPPTPVADAHKRRSKFELVLGLIGAVVSGVAVLGGLDPTAQIILATAAGVVILAAGVSFLRHLWAKGGGQ